MFSFIFPSTNISLVCCCCCHCACVCVCVLLAIVLLKLTTQKTSLFYYKLTTDLLQAYYGLTVGLLQGLLQVYYMFTIGLLQTTRLITQFIVNVRRGGNY